ncbi:MAG: tetratricopeptide repeat protein, partial [Anaerolineaceae bacterium]|nr:tetratricopeptide repeat protein [Anaerolineaceae bacterium]
EEQKAVVESKYPITRTKLIIPRRRDEIVTRQRLLSILNDLLDLKLIIVAAPAGYGKTSLLIDFATHTEWPICWLSLDQLDQDPFRFISHFIAALRVRFPEFGKNSLSVLNSIPQSQLDIPAIVSTIANDIYEHVTEHFIFMLDDYQLVEDGELVNQFINSFLQAADENVHLMVSSRRLLTLSDMPLLVARNQVGGLSFEEIAFTSLEIQELLLKNYHITISDKSAEEITQQTEGWITGLLLSTQLLEDEIGERIRTARVSGVNLYDYMAQQVFEQQPEEIQLFLLRTSILEEYDAQRCKRVIGKALKITESWQSLIDQVMLRNLFVLPVGDTGDLWLRYHHLFRDFLQTRMRKERPEETIAITIALADDFADHQDWEQAFVLYKQVRAVDEMLNLVEKAGPAMVTGGKLLTLKEWMAALPPDIATSRPSLLSLQAAILVNSGEMDQGVQLFTKVIDRLLEDNDPAHVETLALSLIRRAVALQIQGDLQKSLADNQNAIDLLDEFPEYGLIKAEALRNIGVTLYYKGEVKEAINILKESLRLFESYNDQQNVPKVLFNIGLMHKVLGDYVRAEMMYQEALDIWSSGGNLTWTAELLNNLGVLQQLRGDYEKAAGNFEKAIEYSQISNSPKSKSLSLTSLGDLYKDLDAFPESLDVYRQAESIAKQTNDKFLLLYLGIAEGILNRISGDFAKAEVAFEKVRHQATESQSIHDLNQIDSEMALFYLRTGKYDDALVAAEKAYESFQSEGNQSEALRAAFSCSLALSVISDKDEALVYLEKVLPALLENNYATPLIVQARELKDLLSSVKGKHEIKRQFARIVERVDSFEEKLPVTRRKIRRQATIMPFA